MNLKWYKILLKCMQLSKSYLRYVVECIEIFYLLFIEEKILNSVLRNDCLHYSNLYTTHHKYDPMSTACVVVLGLLMHFGSVYYYVQGR